MPSPIIYINSWPGVGKHTIAKQLGMLLGDDARVVRLSILSNQTISRRHTERV